MTVTLTLDKSSYQSDENIEVSYTYTGATNNKHWIGFYPQGVTPNGNPASIQWKYVKRNKTTFTLIFDPLVSGDYTVWFLLNDGYTSAAQVNFDVIAQAVTSNNYSYPADPSVGVDEKCNVTAFNILQNYSYNMETMLSSPEADADILFLSECSSASSTVTLANHLSYDFHVQGGDLAILSKHPIVNSYSAQNGHLCSVIDFGGVEVFCACVHFNYQTYMQAPLQEETRRNQMLDLINNRINPYAGSRPVIVSGDFNAPSHLDFPDWSNISVDDTTDGGADWSTREFFKVSNFTSGIPLKDAGKDSVFQVTTHIDGQEPGGTWIPADYTPVGFRHERIDLIYHSGCDSIWSEFKTLHTYNTNVSTWPTGQDHRAVRGTLGVPGADKTTTLGGGSSNDSEVLPPSSVTSGNNFNVSFDVGSYPASISDWIGIYGQNDTPGVQNSILWLYTSSGTQTTGSPAEINSTLSFTSVSEQSANKWPLSAGVVKVYLFANNNYTIMAGPNNMTVV